MVLLHQMALPENYFSVFLFTSEHGIRSVLEVEPAPLVQIQVDLLAGRPLQVLIAYLIEYGVLQGLGSREPTGWIELKKFQKKINQAAVRVS